MGSTAGYDDWEGDRVDTILFESAQYIKHNNIYELEVSTQFNLNCGVLHEITRTELITSLVNMAIEESAKHLDKPMEHLNLWIYLMIEMRHHQALFQDEIYRNFIKDYQSSHPVIPDMHFLNLPIVVVGKNPYKTKNDNPHLVSIDNFLFGEISVYFENESVKDIQFGKDRPYNLLNQSPQDRELQRRHIISVAWIKEAIRTTFNGQELKTCVEEIQDIRKSLLKRLNLPSWPQYPDQSSLRTRDFEDCLSLYDAEFSEILKKADSIKLTPVEFLCLFCSAYDDLSYYIIDDDLVVLRFKIFACGIAELYRNMVHTSYYQFIGATQDNQRLGKLTYLLKPIVEKWYGEPRFPIQLDLSDEKMRLLKNFFFGENAHSEDRKIVEIDSPQMLIDLYFNAQYDYPEIPSQPRLTNHMKLFMHTYGKHCPPKERAPLNTARRLTL